MFGIMLRSPHRNVLAVIYAVMFVAGLTVLLLT